MVCRRYEDSRLRKSLTLDDDAWVKQGLFFVRRLTASMTLQQPSGEMKGGRPAMSSTGESTKGVGWAYDPAASTYDRLLVPKVFAGVFANFVLSHFANYEMALLDMVQSLRPGGRLGATTWLLGQSEFSSAWHDVAESFISKDLLRDAVRQLIPWEEWFAEATHLREALQDAGLASVDIQSASTGSA